MVKYNIMQAKEFVFQDIIFITVYRIEVTEVTNHKSEQAI